MNENDHMIASLTHNSIVYRSEVVFVALQTYSTEFFYTQGLQASHPRNLSTEMFLCRKYTLLLLALSLSLLRVR